MQLCKKAWCDVISERRKGFATEKTPEKYNANIIIIFRWIPSRENWRPLPQSISRCEKAWLGPLLYRMAVLGLEVSLLDENTWEKKLIFSFSFSDKKFVALKVVKSAAHYTETALDEIKLLKCVSSVLVSKQFSTLY